MQVEVSRMLRSSRVRRVDSRDQPISLSRRAPQPTRRTRVDPGAAVREPLARRGARAVRTARARAPRGGRRRRPGPVRRAPSRERSDAGQRRVLALSRGRARTRAARARRAALRAAGGARDCRELGARRRSLDRARSPRYSARPAPLGLIEDRRWRRERRRAAADTWKRVVRPSASRGRRESMRGNSRWMEIRVS